MISGKLEPYSTWPDHSCWKYQSLQIIHEHILGITMLLKWKERAICRSPHCKHNLPSLAFSNSSSFIDRVIFFFFFFIWDKPSEEVFILDAGDWVMLLFSLIVSQAPNHLTIPMGSLTASLQPHRSWEACGHCTWSKIWGGFWSSWTQRRERDSAARYPTRQHTVWWSGYRDT